MPYDPSRVASILEIQALNAQYNFAVDEADGDAWAACFTTSGVFNALLEGERPVGTEELKKFVTTVNHAFGQMHHLTTNEIISFEGDGKARQKCYLQFFYKKDGQLEGTLCVYDDWLEIENGAWKFSRRDVLPKAKFAHLND
ncbi:nuclear transport factor 2 family protein [Pseudacidovorax intermedius]|uniref:nuclear transport factor 2 family protein n=1 Tax=Pseudacidovorax intermedius TaxID=433924 RepID=UPI0005C28E82|nr:nuclear transport factor 2 family protein [Pseudacidovorax intermedius]